jgi:hypothetical protein
MYAIIKEYGVITTKFMDAFCMHHSPLKYYIQHPLKSFCSFENVSGHSNNYPKIVVSDNPQV